MRAFKRWCAALGTGLATLLVSACDRGNPNQVALAPPTEGVPKKLSPLRNEIPPDQLSPVMEAHLRGLGYMEQLKVYSKAVAEFRMVHQLAPGWIPGSINLAIALLNEAGQKNEQAKKAGGGAAEKPFEEALSLLDDVIARDPENLHAHFTRGIILEYTGQFPEAHREFKVVTERDPNDPHAWLKLGSSLMDPDYPNRQAGPKQAKELVAIYSKAVDHNPYLLPALYKLQTAYGWSGDRDAQAKVLKLWRELDQRSNVRGSGDRSDMAYGEMG
ncbi:MAG TPA: tetratricopeptide repeat protein, partial [Isosphaeraceae bacterium]|nr:tetratricopeptide repeat protein [Isosphaeraceae bacterium]